MPHHLDLIFTLTGGLTAALALGCITQKLRLSPIVGYLLAGVLVGPWTPGFVANHELASQCAEIGVILLMFGVGLHFHLKDLLAVRAVAVPGALVQIVAATALGAVVTHAFGWSWVAGIVFGLAISVASTVVLTRVLADHRALHTPVGHIAIGWLVVEDLFTILVLVLLPAMFANHGGGSPGNVWITLAVAAGKLALLVGFTLIVGQKIIPRFLAFIARTRSRELFTLAVLVLALGIAVGAAQFFGASMALGAFLAGMIVGQSEFGERAAADALSMRDAFAVLFFVSVGMLFDPQAVATGWPLMLATFGIVVIGKPLAALLVVLVLKKPLVTAVSVAVALAQIGEFSFILAALGRDLHILPAEATGALVVAAIASITVNPLLYRAIDPTMRWLHRMFPASRSSADVAPESIALPSPGSAMRVVIIGYGPVGRTLSRLLRANALEVAVIDMNLETVRELRAQGEPAIYGDAMQREILRQAGLENARGLILAASGLPAQPIVEAARELNPQIRILTRTEYLRDAETLRRSGAQSVFTGEGEIALAMTAYLMRELGATDEQIDRERDRIREELFASASSPLAPPQA